MVSEKIGADFVVLRLVVRRNVVLGGVDQAGLQARVDLGEGHRRGRRAHGARQAHPEVGGLDAKLQALRVGHAADRLLRVDRARAALVQGERHEAGLVERREDLGALRAVHRLAEMVEVAEEERERRDHRFRNDPVEGRRVDADHVQRADLHLLDGVLLGAERAVAEDLDLVLAARRPGELFAHVLDGHVGREVLGVNVRRTERPGLQRACGNGECDEPGEGAQLLHGKSPRRRLPQSSSFHSFIFP